MTQWILEVQANQEVQGKSRKDLHRWKNNHVRGKVLDERQGADSEYYFSASDFYLLPSVDGFHFKQFNATLADISLL